MDKRKVRIILAVVISLILVGVVILIGFILRPKEDVEEAKRKGLTNNQTVSGPVGEEIITLEVNGVTYENLNKLSAEQTVVRDRLIQMINKAIQDNTFGYKAKTADIVSIADNQDVTVKVTYEDGRTKEFIVTYDATSMHNFLRCMDKDLYDSIRNGDFAG